MSRYLWIAALLFCSNGSSQQPKPVAGKPEDAVLTTQRQFVDAMGNKNVAALNRIIADDFVGVGASGHAAGKAAMLDFHQGPTSFTSVKMEDPIVKIFDSSTAVVIGKLTNFDLHLHETVRFTMVYRKRANEWKLVAGQLVPTPEE
jgi:ketosteroid isomerase-like protein